MYQRIRDEGKIMAQIDRLKEIVETLRSENGCPWDREQTHTSLKPEVIEEAAEVVCGINILDKTGDAENLKEELGDLLLQVMFHSACFLSMMCAKWFQIRWCAATLMCLAVSLMNLRKSSTQHGKR